MSNGCTTRATGCGTGPTPAEMTRRADAAAAAAEQAKLAEFQAKVKAKADEIECAARATPANVRRVGATVPGTHWDSSFASGVTRELQARGWTATWSSTPQQGNPYLNASNDKAITVTW